MHELVARASKARARLHTCSAPVGALDVLGHDLREHACGVQGTRWCSASALTQLGHGHSMSCRLRAWTVAQLRRCGCAAPPHSPLCTPRASSRRTYPCASSLYHKYCRLYTARRISSASRSLWCSHGGSGDDSPQIHNQTHQRAAVRGARTIKFILRTVYFILEATHLHRLGDNQHAHAVCVSINDGVNLYDFLTAER
jgi:hypothetical protein